MVQPRHVKPSRSDRLISTEIKGQLVSYRPRNTQHPTCLINDPREHMVEIDSCLSKVNCQIFFYDGKVSPYVELIRDIAVGEELFLDYGDDYWQGKYRRGTSHFLRDPSPVGPTSREKHLLFLLKKQDPTYKSPYPKWTGETGYKQSEEPRRYRAVPRHRDASEAKGCKEAEKPVR